MVQSFLRYGERGNKFEEKLYYTSNPANNSQCFNGNISYSTWTYNNAIKGYAYSYDQLNRLTTSMFAENHIITDDFYYYMEWFNYDKMGNIIQLTRNGSDDTNDQLYLTYNGNQLKNVWDDYGSRNQYNVKEYQDKASIDSEMAYDDNGNLKKDLDRDIVTIKYNLLNLPEIIQFKNGNQIRNLYDASGQKLSTRNVTIAYFITEPIIAEEDIYDLYDMAQDNEEIYIEGTEYIGNVEYSHFESYYMGGFYDQGIDFQRLYNSEGYSDLGYSFSYYRKDHLGNNREVWRAPFKVGNTNYAATTTQRTQYYPSGLPWASNSGDNPWMQNKKFNGCEFIEMHGLDVTDLGNRGVQNATNRFTSLDRFCEKFPWQSPYVHAGNNPVNYVDVMGDSIWTETKTTVNNPDGTTSIQTNRYYYGQDANGNSGFIGADGKIYSGNDKFVTDLSTALGTLSGKSSGKELVDALTSDKKSLTIEQTAGMTTFSTSGKLLWNNDGTKIDVETTAGKQSASSFIELGHDLAHAQDLFKGTFDKTEWIKGSGVLNAEKFSMHIENKIRSEHGMSLRTIYDSAFPATRNLGFGNTSLNFFSITKSGLITPHKY